MITETIYQCEKCKTIYASAELAQTCEAQTVIPRAGVGDIVTCHAGFGWFDGDKSWVSNPGVLKGDPSRPCPDGNGNCFAPCCTYAFYYVVGAIEVSQTDNHYRREPETRLGAHRWRYHLFTRAMPDKGGYFEGWTEAEGHSTPVYVHPQPKLDGAEALIGRRSERLL